MEKAYLADEAGLIMADLPKEDDNGNIEYKLRLTNLTMEKVRKRTTQMAFRLKVSVCCSVKSFGLGRSRSSVLSDWCA